MLDTILSLLNKDGTHFYAIGGCVRDLLLGIPLKDIDIATSLSYEKLVLFMHQRGLHFSVKHKKYNTLVINLHGYQIDITPFRLDINSKVRHTKHQYTASIREDSLRRDFTCNAIYFDGKRFIDFHRGIEHIYNRYLCCVGQAKERMREDLLRVLRYIRFSVYLGKLNAKYYFQYIYPYLRQALTMVTPCRIKDEYTKIANFIKAHGIDNFKLRRYLNMLKSMHQQRVFERPINDLTLDKARYLMRFMPYSSNILISFIMKLANINVSSVLSIHRDHQLTQRYYKAMKQDDTRYTLGLYSLNTSQKTFIWYAGLLHIFDKISDYKANIRHFLHTLSSNNRPVMRYILNKKAFIRDNYQHIPRVFIRRIYQYYNRKCQTARQ